MDIKIIFRDMMEGRMKFEGTREEGDICKMTNEVSNVTTASLSNH